jgi:1,4-alpha-glucan branching enzyme
VSKPENPRRPVAASLQTVLTGDAGERAAILAADHGDPHHYLGPHAATHGAEDGTVVRVLRPDAARVRLLADGDPIEMTSLGDGLFAVWRPGIDPAAAYRLEVEDRGGATHEHEDPYRFPPTVSEFDLYLFSEGTHRRLWEGLGARPAKVEGVAGFSFALWAPNARRVSVVGDLCGWDGRRLQMRRLGRSGVFEIFVPELTPGAVYKYEILTQDGATLLKADPMAAAAEVPPATASRTYRSSYRWRDAAWMRAAESRDVTREPMAIYEVHAGSWMEPPSESGAGCRPSYRELAPALVEHVKLLGFNYIQLMPIAEHPFDGSWGYQITGFYAPTARYGDPDDFRFFVDHCHRNGIGVILDWVPAHFVKDAHGLGLFDGSALYEHQDPRQGLHPDWDTYIFNYGRHEVRSFLTANALYWLDQFHVDGLRVDAVASMLYLDYSREAGEWLPNAHGGNENLAAVAFLQGVNEAVRELYPGRFVVAEESTAWPGVTRPAGEGGLGFTLKWNMGWMHDTLGYFSTDPYFRAGSQDRLTFAMIYEYSERFINPLSHDEVVHGKRSLLDKMPGDLWQRLANLRTLFVYQLTRPGKKLIFMGSELAPAREWDHQSHLDWYLLGDPARHGVFLLVCDLGALYRSHPCLWQSDPDPGGFRWIACWDKDHSVVCYERRTTSGGEDGEESLLVVLNLTPVPRERYRIGTPERGLYRCLLSSDDERYGGSGYGAAEEVATEDVAADDHRQSLVLDLPPLAALVLAPDRPREGKSAKTEKGH